ncbi:MAG: YchJ family protein [Pseudomonadales bacterium]
MSDTPPCYCGNPSAFKHCCGPLLSGKAIAKTAEQLMRSRFSAFCSGNIDYLISSHHPSKRKPDDQQTLTHTISQYEWLNLKIKKTSKGLCHDSEGDVEFIATYTQRAQLSQLHENSRFIKENNQWFYLDGDIFARPDKSSNSFRTINVKRNDPCWCGSGKKFKHCHG